MSKKNKKEELCDCGCDLCHEENVIRFGKISETESELYMRGKTQHIEILLNIISSLEFY